MDVYRFCNASFGSCADDVASLAKKQSDPGGRSCGWKLLAATAAQSSSGSTDMRPALPSEAGSIFASRLLTKSPISRWGLLSLRFASHPFRIRAGRGRRFEGHPPRRCGGWDGQQLAACR